MIKEEIPKEIERKQNKKDKKVNERTKERKKTIFTFFEPNLKPMAADIGAWEKFASYCISR